MHSLGLFRVIFGLNDDEGAVLRMSLKLLTLENMSSAGELISSSLASALKDSSSFSVMVELSMTERLESVSVNGLGFECFTLSLFSISSLLFTNSVALN